jgi:uncharacterized membrane protein
MASDPALIVCPACGGHNAPEAVFCANPACHKALGEFDYVLEQLRAETRWHEALAERVTGFIGHPYFFGVHQLWFILWALVNTSTVALIGRFDAYPFALLGILLGAEAIFITGFLLISQNRQNRHADKRAELDYEVNVRTYRQIHEIADTLQKITHRLDAIEAVLSSQVSPPKH